MVAGEQSHQLRLQHHLNAAAAAAAAAAGYPLHPSLSAAAWTPLAAPAVAAGPFLGAAGGVELSNGPSPAPPPPRSVRAAPPSAAPSSSADHAGRAGGGGGSLYTCSLCPYRTPLRANFHLHCQTDKHAQRVRQYGAMTAAAAAAAAAQAASPAVVPSGVEVVPGSPPSVGEHQTTNDQLTTGQWVRRILVRGVNAPLPPEAKTSLKI